MSFPEPTECSWQVNGLKVGGLCWGDSQLPPILMLHGWLDNAASFAMLAPQLQEHHVVAIDLTGHGQSDRRSADASYQIWDDLPEIFGVIEQLGWSKFDLLGHSRGAIISTLIAGAFPERVKRLVLLDAMFPEAVSEQSFCDQMRKAIDQKPALLVAKNRVFPALSDGIVLRTNAQLNPEAAALLVARGVKACDEGLTWTTDRRLYGASAVKLTEGQIQAVSQRLTMPTLLLLAEGGRMDQAEASNEMLAHTRGVTVERVIGGHHFHMEPPLQPLAVKILSFLHGEVL
ncbi:MAG: pimeloyl-ACP methyl ester carboxylesterase [Halioglobus sp.]|jgi:pimeloyl-ACP methyl ester carboxylesterase